MSNISQKQLIELFQSYKYNELYELVKDAQYDTTEPIVTQYELAIKAMTLISWWADDYHSKEILDLFPLSIKEPLTHFCVAYGYMCLGDVKKFEYYLKHKPKNYSTWMINYLQIEFYGRSKKYKEQIEVVRKLTKKKKYPEDYIKIALIQSLNQKKPNISYLKQYIEDIDLINDNNPLSIALCLEVQLLTIDDVNIDISKFPILLYHKAKQNITQNNLVDVLKINDQLAQDKFFSLTMIKEWLNMSISLPQGFDYFMARANFALNLVPDNPLLRGSVASFTLIYAYLTAQYNVAYNIVKTYMSLLSIPSTKVIKNEQVFFIYILNLSKHWQDNQELYEKQPNQKELQIFGESHSLSFANINIKLNNQAYHCKSNFMMGIKMHHLSNPKSSHVSNFLLEHISKIEINSDVLFTIGEIDTRPDEGIWQVYISKGNDLESIIDTTVLGYINFLYENLKDKSLSTITIQGIPAPIYELKDISELNVELFLNMIKKVNSKLKEETLKRGWNFLDVYSATLGADGKWHIDKFHLLPSFYQEADKWLIKPEPKEQPKTTTIDFSKPLTISLSKPS